MNGGPLLYTFSETIFGYRDLRVKLYYTAARLTTYMDIDYKDKADPNKFEGVEVCLLQLFYDYCLGVLEPLCCFTFILMSLRLMM